MILGRDIVEAAVRAYGWPHGKYYVLGIKRSTGVEMVLHMANVRSYTKHFDRDIFQVTPTDDRNSTVSVCFMHADGTETCAEFDLATVDINMVRQAACGNFGTKNGVRMYRSARRTSYNELRETSHLSSVLDKDSPTIHVDRICDAAHPDDVSDGAGLIENVRVE